MSDEHEPEPLGEEREAEPAGPEASEESAAAEPQDRGPDEPAAVPSAEEEPAAFPFGSPDEAAASDAELEELASIPPQELRAILEALIFASPQPLTERQIEQVLGGLPKDEWKGVLEEIRTDYAREGRGLQLIEVAGGYQITTRPEYHDWRPAFKARLERLKAAGHTEATGRYYDDD